MTPTGTLLITRPRQYADMFRRYRIFVDEVEVGRVRRNEKLTIPLPPGDHTVVARIDWARSNLLRAHIRAGETTELEVGANAQGRTLFTALYSATLGAESYLYLRQRWSASR